MSKDDANPPEKDAGFLIRWSARKRQESPGPTSKIKEASELDTETNLNSLNAELKSEPASSAPLASVEGVKSDDQSLDSSDAKITTEAQEPPLLTDEDMPALETLTAKSDLSDFFNKGVSASLRRAAFRHVFSLPIYNERDGLNDYDDDYTKFEPLGDTVTSDMKWHKARKEREAAEAEEERKRLAEEAEAQEKAEEEAQALEEDEAQADAENESELDTEQEALESEGSQEPIESLDSEGVNDKDAEGDGASERDPLLATTKQPETTA